MKPIDKKILQSVKEFDDSLLKYVKSKLLPAFKGLTFGAPQCDYDIDDEGSASVNGIIYDNANDSTFHYTIALYPEDDKVRVNITKFHQGNLCRISDIDHWHINGDNLTSKAIKEKFKSLTEMEQKYYKKRYGE